jgi:predicted ATPase/DNA-binding winged helix-turn-helix (wHTH) protein
MIGTLRAPAEGRLPVYRAGGWEVDLAQRQLRSNGVPVPIGGRAFDIIGALVQSDGGLISKDELVRQVWPAQRVDEHTLPVHISAIRKAFGASRDMLKTAPGRGYYLLGGWSAEPGGDIIEQPRPELAERDDRPRLYNLPAATSLLVGRAEAVRHIRDLLSAYRVVTLVGPGGIGKTALAVVVARSLTPDFDGDIAFVELGTLSDPTVVLSALTTTLGLELGYSQVSPEHIARVLGARKMMLVLDSCEHVIESTALLAEALVRLCPRITVLATSREVLNIDGERVFRVAGLDAPRSTADGFHDVLKCSAVELLIAKTRAAGAVFELTPANLRAIAAICRRLDGIPLAIEFAAAGAAVLGFEMVAFRLNDCIDTLAKGRRTALPRHRTLRASLDWSYDLLTPPEQHLLRRIAVFATGFSLEGTAAVVVDANFTVAMVLEALANLASKSLVVRDEPDQANRWRLLETVRVYALEKLTQSGDADHATRCMVAFYIERLAVEARAKPAPETLKAFCGEIDSIRAGLDWAFSTRGDAALGIALTIRTVPIWVQLSLMGECRSRVICALARLPDDGVTSLTCRMHLLAALGWSLMYGGASAEQTDDAWSATLSLARQLDDSQYRLRALWGLWINALNTGSFRRALELAEEHSRLAAVAADASEGLLADRMLAASWHYCGDQRTANVHVEHLLDRYTTLGLKPQVARLQFDHRVTAHYFQARISWLRGNVDRAMQIVFENIGEAEELDHALSLGSVLGQGACPIALLNGDWAAAARFGMRLLEHSRRHGLRVWETWANCFLALVEFRQGGDTGRLIVLEAALDEAGTGRRLPRYLMLLAGLAACRGASGEVARGLATVDELVARCEGSGEEWYLPELYRLKGELLLSGGTGDRGLAEELFGRAIELARRQDALSWELRAATNLAALQRDRGQMADAQRHLTSILTRFSQGSATADIQAARTLLGSLSPG